MVKKDHSGTRLKLREARIRGTKLGCEATMRRREWPVISKLPYENAILNVINIIFQNSVNIFQNSINIVQTSVATALCSRALAASHLEQLTDVRLAGAGRPPHHHHHVVGAAPPARVTQQVVHQHRLHLHLGGGRGGGRRSPEGGAWLPRPGRQGWPHVRVGTAAAAAAVPGRTRRGVSGFLPDGKTANRKKLAKNWFG